MDKIDVRLTMAGVRIFAKYLMVSIPAFYWRCSGNDLDSGLQCKRDYQH